MKKKKVTSFITYPNLAKKQARATPYEFEVHKLGPIGTSRYGNKITHKVNKWIHHYGMKGVKIKYL
jgi:hypothetical protein